MKLTDAYIYYAKMKIMTSLVYRFEVFASILSTSIMMCFTVFIWKTVYHGVTQVDGLSEKQMITYAIISALLTIIFSLNVDKALFERGTQGDIAIDFIRPTHILLCYLSEDIGMALGNLVNKFLPMLILVSALFFKPAPASAVSFGLFVISAVLSYGILWLINAIVGVLNIRMLDLGSVGFIKDVIIGLLSGGLIPIWFLPQKIQTVLSFFPFQYTYQTPLGIFIGKYNYYDALTVMIIQGIWLCLLWISLNFLWEKLSKNIMIQGG